MTSAGPQPNPYAKRADRVDSSGLADTSQRPTGLIIAAALEAWTAIYTAFRAPSTLRQFHEMFAAFGAELPLALRRPVAATIVCWVLAAISIALLAWIALRARPSLEERRYMKGSLWTFGIAFGALVAWVIVEIYVLVFKLGSVI